MKTKDLNFIEAYWAYKDGHEVFENDLGVTMKSICEDPTAVFNIDSIVNRRFHIKPKPLTAEFECEWICSRGTGSIHPEGPNVGDLLEPFIGKKTRVTITEVVE